MPTGSAFEEIRRANLRAVAKDFGGNAALAAALDVTPAAVSQWVNGSRDSKTGKPRGMSHATCRRIEKAANKPPGWMDVGHDHSTIPPVAPTLEEALEVIGRELAAPLARDVRDDVADAMHKLVKRNGSARDQAQVLALLRDSDGKRRQQAA